MTDDGRATSTSAAPSMQPRTARRFLQEVEQALTQLATLRITTVIGDVDVTGSDSGIATSVKPNVAAEAARTDIDLLSGRITNIFSTPGGGAMQLFHRSQVEKSSTIVAVNLAELQRLAGALLSPRR